MKVFGFCFVDQLTTNVPQGAKRLDKKSKVSIKLEEDNLKEIKKSISTADKEFLDKDTRKIDTSKDFGEVYYLLFLLILKIISLIFQLKNVKFPLIESKTKNLYQPESLEIDHRFDRFFDIRFH